MTEKPSSPPWAVSLLLALLGGLLVLFPELANAGPLVVYKGSLQTFGGILIGVGVASVTGYQSIRETAGSIYHLIQQNTNAIAIDEERQIGGYAKRWYFYYKTQMNDQIFWRMVRLDFGHGFGGVRLTQRIALSNKRKDKEYYKVEAVTRYRKFILYFYPEVRTVEPTMTAVLQTAYAPPYAGVMQLMTWDRMQRISPCIIAAEPIGSWTVQNDPVPDAVAEILEKMWQKQIEAVVDTTLLTASGDRKPRVLSEDETQD